MVHLNFNAFSAPTNDITNYKWVKKEFYDELIPFKNAGGCGNDDLASFWLNPQFDFTLKLPNKVDNKVYMIVSLMQLDERIEKRYLLGANYTGKENSINFHIFKVKEGAIKDSSNKFSKKDLTKIYCNEYYTNGREVTARLNLDPGDYVIIPSTFEPNMEMKYLIRVFLEGRVENFRDSLAQGINSLGRLVLNKVFRKSI